MRSFSRSHVLYIVTIFTALVLLGTEYLCLRNKIDWRPAATYDSRNLNRFRCVIIIRAGGGRLGNKMFLFASAYGLARRHQCALYTDAVLLQNLTEVFQIQLNNT